MALWTTTSIPRPSGRWSRGDMNVLSTTVRILFPADPRGPFQVGDLHQGVRRRLDEQRLRLPADLFPHGGRIPHVHVVEGEAVGAQERLEQAVRPAVEIVRTEDVVSRPEEGHQGGDRRHPRGKGDGAGSPFEVREGFLRRLARRVLSPRVVESPVLPEALVPVDGGRVDRCADGAVRLVRPHPRLRAIVSTLRFFFKGSPVSGDNLYIYPIG